MHRLPSRCLGFDAEVSVDGTRLPAYESSARHSRFAICLTSMTSPPPTARTNVEYRCSDHVCAFVPPSCFGLGYWDIRRSESKPAKCGSIVRKIRACAEIQRCIDPSLVASFESSTTRRALRITGASTMRPSKMNAPAVGPSGMACSNALAHANSTDEGANAA